MLLQSHLFFRCGSLNSRKTLYLFADEDSAIKIFFVRKRKLFVNIRNRFYMLSYVVIWCGNDYNGTNLICFQCNRVNALAWFVFVVFFIFLAVLAVNFSSIFKVGFVIFPIKRVSSRWVLVVTEFLTTESSDNQSREWILLYML